MKKAAIIFAGVIYTSAASAQEAVPAIDVKSEYTVKMTGEELQALLNVAQQCDARVPFACAEYLLFTRRKFISASPTPKKD